MESEDSRQALVDPPDLLGTSVPYVVTQAIDVDGPELLDKNPGRLSLDHQLRPERGWPGAPGRRCQQGYRPRKQRGGRSS